MPKLYVAHNVPCKVCGKGLLSIPPLLPTEEEANAWGEQEFRRLASGKQLAFKARTCSGQCYAALPSWRRIALKSLPFLAGRLGF